MIIHFCAFLCVASEDNALVSCRERVMRFFDMSRERITCFFELSREMDPRASSGKKICVKSRYPERFRFLGLCGPPPSPPHEPELQTHSLSLLILSFLSFEKISVGV